MVFLRSAPLVLFLAARTVHESEASSHHRELSNEFIAGYEPRSIVTDHAAIDLDLQEIQFQLALDTNTSLSSAKDIYQSGIHTKSVAQVQLISPLTFPISKGAEVVGHGESGEVRASVYENYPAGAQVIKIQYSVSSIQSDFSSCLVGASPNPQTEGCLKSTGTFTISGLSGPVSYTYDPLQHNTNEITLQWMSTEAQALMYSCDTCPYVTYKKFVDYYGPYDYADKWVTAAFDGKSTDFVNGNGEFGRYGNVGRTEAIQKGIYMNVFMYVIREMEAALDACNDDCDGDDCSKEDPVQAWDSAVAFYTGSLEGQEGSGDGLLLHALADKRCINFKTCGDLADSEEGISHVNIEIFRLFEDGMRKILSSECSTLRDNKERIEQLMAIPFVQGTLRYAYKKEYEVEFNDWEKAEAEGAAFTAAILPLVNYCNEFDADRLYYEMRTGTGHGTEFLAVKTALERNYHCMGIRCADVGGLWDPVTRKHLPYATPCSRGNRRFGHPMVFAVVTMAVSAATTFF